MEPLKHECGIAMIRLMKPVEYYEKKYGTKQYALGKLYLMMEKQHNRGQEGAGIACVNMHTEPGQDYILRERAEGKDTIAKVFQQLAVKESLSAPSRGESEGGLDGALGATLFMGHLRYSTTGKSGLTYVHPFLRRNNWRAKNLCICGNFNMTNIEEVFGRLLDQGMTPRVYSDTFTLLELMGHRLDREAERNFVCAKKQGLQGREITDYIDHHMDLTNVLRTTMPHFDGGYVICALTGSGEMCAMRDPSGIRPAFYYADEEIVTVASERPVLQTTFNLEASQVRELRPGEALIVNADGHFRLEQIISAAEYLPCSFERIYFSRGNDADIYRERKALGRNLVPSVLKAIEGDVPQTVFSFIPNTAEVAYLGMLEALRGQFPCVRSEKVVSKDIKLRTFITEDASRNDLAAHVYDITYGCLEAHADNLVVIDDSIVRGTTLRESIIRILDRLHPRKLVIVSSAPQIRYPDFYGIDMSRIGDFIAFQAAVELLKDKGMERVITEVYVACKQGAEGNPVKAIYASFTDEEISAKMSHLLTPPDVGTKVEIIFQSVEGLHEACPGHPGDWYFTGNYPTPGGLRMLKKAYADWFEKNN